MSRQSGDSNSIENEAHNESVLDVNKFEDGEVKILFRSGYQYEGGYYNGQRHGWGSFQFTSGSRFDGEYKAGLKHGSGKFIYSDGSCYEGKWKLNKKHGFGKYIYPNGDVYEGGCINDVKHGVGAYKYKEVGIAFKATWIDGSLKGPIEIIYQNFRYHGSWSKDIPIGEGVFSFGMKYMLLGHVEMSFKPAGIQTANETTKSINMGPRKSIGQRDDETVENADESAGVCVPRFIAHEVVRYDYSKLPLQPIPIPQDSSTTICTQGSYDTFTSSSFDDDSVSASTPIPRCNYHAF